MNYCIRCAGLGKKVVATARYKHLTEHNKSDEYSHICTSCDEYEKMRREFIPIAASNANQKVRELGKESEERPGVDKTVVTHDFFTEFFNSEMERLVSKKRNDE